MELPKFLLGDNTDFPDAIFVIHTEFPRFITIWPLMRLNGWKILMQKMKES